MLPINLHNLVQELGAFDGLNVLWYAGDEGQHIGFLVCVFEKWLIILFDYIQYEDAYVLFADLSGQVLPQ